MKKLIYTLFFISILSSGAYAKTDTENENYNQQWKTVIDLQRLIEADLLQEIPNLFSKNVRIKIINLIKKDPEFFIQSWKLDNIRTKKYKDMVFSGKGIFIFEDNEWKINEI